AAFVWDPSDPAAPPPPGGFHRAVLTGAGTTAGALAHALNLAFTVKIPWTGFQAGDFSNAASRTFLDTLRLVVAPVVQVGGATLTPSAAGVAGDPVAQSAYDSAGGFEVIGNNGFKDADAAAKAFADSRATWPSSARRTSCIPTSCPTSRRS